MAKSTNRQRRLLARALGHREITTEEEWHRLKHERPDLFERACQIEEMMQSRRVRLGRDPVWMTDQGVKEHATLRVLHSHDQLRLVSGEDSCDGGACMT